METMVTEASLASRLMSAIGYRRRTQTDVAKKVGVSLNTLTRITRGETLSPGYDLLRSLAVELNVSMDYLAGLSDDIERR